jgi:hypothetical protein
MFENFLTAIGVLADWRFKQFMRGGGWSYDNARYMLARWADYSTQGWAL